MSIEEMKRRKKEMGLSNEKLAELSGVPLGTVMKIFGGVTKSPRYQTIQALEKTLYPEKDVIRKEAVQRPADHEASDAYTYSCGFEYRQEGLAGEALPAYKSVPADPLDPEDQEGDPDHGLPVHRTKQGRKYTIDDYYAFKDEKRRELIDGKFFIMEAPSVRHQMIIGELYILFRECIRLHEKQCRVLLSPCDVQLNADRYTMVQPDILIVCDREKIRTRVCMGAPDLAVEIMSPSSRSRDAVLKLNKYMHAGVREYWLVDPENRCVLVYLRDEGGDGDGTYHWYSFEDTIPVGISDGMCAVDFSIVAREIEDL